MGLGKRAAPRERGRSPWCRGESPEWGPTMGPLPSIVVSWRQPRNEEAPATVWKMGLHADPYR
jgi:hypothetical protein